MADGPFGGPRPFLSEKETSIDVFVEREDLDINYHEAKETWASVRSDDVSGQVSVESVEVHSQSEGGFRLKENINYTEELPLSYLNKIKSKFSSALDIDSSRVSITINIVVPT